MSFIAGRIMINKRLRLRTESWRGSRLSVILIIILISPSVDGQFQIRDHALLQFRRGHVRGLIQRLGVGDIELTRDGAAQCGEMRAANRSLLPRSCKRCGHVPLVQASLNAPSGSVYSGEAKL